MDHPEFQVTMAGWRDFTIPLYPGNYVAHKLKAMHDDSKPVFPESVYSTKTQANKRWKSMTKDDYIPLEEIRRKARGTEKLNENQVSVKLGWSHLLNYDQD